jgi:hypothetical protein
MGIFQQKIEFASLGKKGHFTLFEQILAMLDGKMQEPNSFGWYHLLCLAIVVALCALIICKRKSFTPQRIRLNIGIAALLLILFEVYKQLNFSYNAENDRWGYQWYAFPFQFCSTPMYVMLAATFLKNGKVQRSLYSFLATYGFFAGLAVMCYPNDVFIETIGINVQTMVHHGFMVVVGVFMYATGAVKISHKTILHALPTFAALVAIALTANILYWHVGDRNQTFNMFFISPYYACTLPVLSAISETVPYFVFLACYILGFSIAGYVVSLLPMATVKISTKVCTLIKNKNVKYS